MKNFKEYMWYLLSSPFKLVKKKVNQWWIFIRVLGGFFDEVKGDIQRARDETTIATCSDEMLRYHGEDRGMQGIWQYEGEDYDAFRSRIALFDETERMGGTKAGVLMALQSIGYDNTDLIWMPKYNGDDSRWAEFIVIINEDIANPMPTSNANMIKEVRDKKESPSKDNYLINYSADLYTNMIEDAFYEFETFSMFYKRIRLRGSRELDGSEHLIGTTGTGEMLENYLIQTKTTILTLMESAQMYRTKTETQFESVGAKDTMLPQMFFAMQLLDGGSRLKGDRKLAGTTGTGGMFENYLLQTKTTMLALMESAQMYMANTETRIETLGAKDTMFPQMFFNRQLLDGGSYLNGDRKLVGTTGVGEFRMNSLNVTQTELTMNLTQETRAVAKVHSYAGTRTEHMMSGTFYQAKRLDGSRKLDGFTALDSQGGLVELIIAE